MKHVMVDLETMGNSPYAAIVQFGAVEFDPHFLEEEDGYRFYRGKLGREFFANVELQSSIDAGLMVDADTTYWWLEQSESARKALLPNRQNLFDVLTKFSDFWKETGAETLWAHGTSFDIAVIKSAYRKLKLKQPFAYNADRDTRSIFDSGAGWPASKTRPGQVEHNALDDAKTQAIQVCDAYHRVRLYQGVKETEQYDGTLGGEKEILIKQCVPEIPKEVWDKLEPNAVIDAHAAASRVL